MMLFRHCGFNCVSGANLFALAELERGRVLRSPAESASPGGGELKGNVASWKREPLIRPRGLRRCRGLSSQISFIRPQ